MESFSSRATKMIRFRVAALSSRLPVHPRISTATPIAIVLCLFKKNQSCMLNVWPTWHWILQQQKNSVSLVYHIQQLIFSERVVCPYESSEICLIHHVLTASVYLSMRSHRSCLPWGRVASSSPEVTPIWPFTSSETFSILATCSMYTQRLHQRN